MSSPLPSAAAAELPDRVRRFVRETVTPDEKDRRNHGHGPSEDLVHELRPHAREAGLMAPDEGNMHLLERVATTAQKQRRNT